MTILKILLYLIPLLTRNKAILMFNLSKNKQIPTIGVFSNFSETLLPSKHFYKLPKSNKHIDIFLLFATPISQTPPLKAITPLSPSFSKHALTINPSIKFSDVSLCLPSYAYRRKVPL